MIAAAQCFFRSDDNGPLQGEQAHAFGTSTHNQRVENWWSHLKKACTNWWIQFFKDLIEERQLNLNDEYTKESLWFAFNGVLQSSLDEVQLYWNTHYIRPSRHETVAGVPDILFAIPEQFGGFDCRVAVSNEKLREVQTRCEQQQRQNENPFEEYFNYLMEFHEMQYPSDYNEAGYIFDTLMRYA